LPAGADRAGIGHVDLVVKLQLKPDQSPIVVGLPAGSCIDLDGVEQTSDPASAQALLVFVADAESLDGHRGQIVSACGRGRVVWVAYPKGGQLDTDLNRDRLAAALSVDGLRPVRQIAVDDIWSALRFRTAWGPAGIGTTPRSLAVGGRQRQHPTR